MAIDTTAEIVKFRKAPLTGAERARNYRLRKKAKAVLASPASAPLVAAAQNTAGGLLPERTQITGPTHVTRHVTFASVTMTVCALGLAGVGITMNGWFARSLGSSDIAGWLFLAIGVAADCVALAVPSIAAKFWKARERASALAGWGVWVMTFIFAVTAGIGFASLNISDVTAARASRVTPAVTAAQNALSDAMTARDRECRGGIGKFCREREATVTERRNALDAAMKAVEAEADPQTEAAMKIVTWLSQGWIRPKADDFAMLRLVLLALLPQIGGILLMLGRAR